MVLVSVMEKQKSALATPTPQYCNGDSSTNQIIDFVVATSDLKLFDYLRATEISAYQFRLFRHVLFARVYLTIPSICQALRNALLVQDYLTAKTCLHNLNEELAEPNHQELMERAFNCVGERVFGLPPVTLRECYDRPLLVEEVLYRSTVEMLYEKHSIVVSMCQELASGGTLEQHGMMGKMYQVFLAIYLRGLLDRDDFISEVLPYFQAHLSIDDGFNLITDSRSVEFNHGMRAVADYQRTLTHDCMPIVAAFSTAQNLLFAALLRTLS